MTRLNFSTLPVRFLLVFQFFMFGISTAAMAHDDALPHHHVSASEWLTGALVLVAVGYLVVRTLPHLRQWLRGRS